MPSTPLTRLLAGLVLAGLLAACSVPAASIAPAPTPPRHTSAPAPSAAPATSPTVAVTPAAIPAVSSEPSPAPADEGPSTGDDPSPVPQWAVYRRGGDLYATQGVDAPPQLLAYAGADQSVLPWAATPDGSALAFVRAGGLDQLGGELWDASIALYVIGAGIPGERKLLDLLPPGGVDLTPGEEAAMGLLPALTWNQRLAWAPDGGGLVVASAHEGQVDLYTVALDGSTTKLTDTPEIETMPAWNPDGTLVAAATLTSFGTGAGWSDIGLSVARGDGSGEVYTQSPTETASGVLAVSRLIWPDASTLLAELPGFFGPGQVHAIDVVSGDETIIFSGDVTGTAWSLAAGALAIGAASYSEDSPAGPGLYLWRPGDAEARRIAEGSVAQMPVWSPTGQWVAFIVESEDQAGDVWLAPMDPEREPRPLSRGPAQAIVWSPDGKLIATGDDLWHLNGSPVDPLPGVDATPVAWADAGLFFLSRDDPAGDPVLRLWTELGSTDLDRGLELSEVRLVGLRLPEAPRLDPAGLLPDIYTSTESAAGLSVQALDPATGAQRELGVIPYEPGGISHVWAILPSPDGRKIAVSATGAEPLSQLYVIEDGRTRMLSDAAADNSPHAWSPDGRTLLVLSTRNAPEPCVQYTCFYDIYAIDVAAGVERQLTATDDAEDEAVWSPSGDRVAFTRGCSDHGNESCGPSLYVMGADGSGERLLAEGWVDEVAFSPDGAQIAYTRRVDGFTSVYVVPAGGGEPRLLAGEPQMTDLSLRWSPDGSTIAFTRIEGVCQVEHCTEAVYVAGVSGGAPRLVRDVGERGKLLRSLWTPDGRLVLAVREQNDEARLLTYTADGAPLGEARVTIPRSHTEP